MVALRQQFSQFPATPETLHAAVTHTTSHHPVHTLTYGFSSVFQRGVLHLLWHFVQLHAH